MLRDFINFLHLVVNTTKRPKLKITLETPETPHAKVQYREMRIFHNGVFPKCFH